MPESLDQLAATLRDRLVYAAGTAIDCLPRDWNDAQTWAELGAAWWKFQDFVADSAEKAYGYPRDLEWLRAPDPTSRIIRKLGARIGFLLLEREHGQSAMRLAFKEMLRAFYHLDLSAPEEQVNKAHARELEQQTGQHSS